MQLERILTDENGRELTERGTPLFPISVHENDMHAFPAHFVPWHWHEEFEIVRVTEGTLKLELPNAATVLSQNECAVIGSNALHAMHPGDGTVSRMNTIVFDAEIVAGAAASIFQSRYVLPLANREAFSAFVFAQDYAVSDEMVRLIRQIETAYAEKPFGYELLIRNYLSEIWLILLQNSSMDSTQKLEEDSCIRQLLSHIHGNYAEALTLEDIARSADVSCRTASRAFRKQLHTSIFEYLQEYRIRKAAEQLFLTDASITDICYGTGFNDPSYFTRRFRALTGMTPREYRRLAKSAGTLPAPV